MKKLYGMLLLSALILCSCGEKETEPTTTAADTTTVVEPTTTIGTTELTTESPKEESNIMGGDDNVQLLFLGVTDGEIHFTYKNNSGKTLDILVSECTINGDKYTGYPMGSVLFGPSDNYDLLFHSGWLVRDGDSEPNFDDALPKYETGTISGTVTYKDEDGSNENSFTFSYDY